MGGGGPALGRVFSVVERVTSLLSPSNENQSRSGVLVTVAGLLYIFSIYIKPLHHQFYGTAIFHSPSLSYLLFFIHAMVFLPFSPEMGHPQKPCFLHLPHQGRCECGDKRLGHCRWGDKHQVQVRGREALDGALYNPSHSSHPPGAADLGGEAG